MLVSNPAVMIVCIILILAIGYFDIGIASLMLVLFFIVLFGSANPDLASETGGRARIEGFKTTTSDGDDITNQNEEDEPEAKAEAEAAAAETTTQDIDQHIKKISKNLTRSQSNLKKKEENDKKLDDRVSSIKNVVLSTINNIRNSNNDDYKRALLENKQAMLTEEHENNARGSGAKGKGKNNNNNNNNNNNKEDFKDTSRRKGGKEKFQTVEVRALDPSNEDDTNLLITKEILQDMLNRIEYNYESNKYLRKYIKHRVEEIIDINKLTDDE
jgi:Sec-independent protein translocase protein TatA